MGIAEEVFLVVLQCVGHGGYGVQICTKDTGEERNIGGPGWFRTAKSGSKLFCCCSLLSILARPLPASSRTASPTDQWWIRLWDA